MPVKRVLSVGQCAADHAAISRTVRSHFAAEIIPADTLAETLAEVRAQPFALVLVNRVLESDGSSGLEVVRRLQSDDTLREVPIMLVSNHEEAQQEAVQSGAVLGFGKASLGQPRMLERLTQFLEPA